MKAIWINTNITIDTINSLKSMESIPYTNETHSVDYFNECIKESTKEHYNDEKPTITRHGNDYIELANMDYTVRTFISRTKHIITI